MRDLWPLLVVMPVMTVVGVGCLWLGWQALRWAVRHLVGDVAGAGGPGRSPRNGPPA